MKIIRIKDPTYFRDIFFVYNFTTQEINKWFKKEKIQQEWSEGISGRHLVITENKNGYQYNYIFVAGKKLTSWVEASLGHEVLHHTFKTLQDVGIKFSEDSEEAFTYYWQYIFNQCLKELYKLSK